MLPSIAQVLLTLHVLISLTPPPRALNRLQQVDALPITSKPIESTAENLAWQAWIMMPPHEQNLEKSRKVTPKSIFLLPNRVKPQTSNVGGQSWTMESESGSGLYAPIECPPGQRQFESRCISTVDIDREQLLIQELQILLQHGDNNGNNGNQNAYDYDYDYDEETVAAVEANYKAPMMFRGGDELASSAVSLSGSGNYDDAVRLPNEDAPLKFNIFSDNYPTDLEAPQKQPLHMMANLNNSNPPWNFSQMLGLSQLPNATNTLSDVYGVPAAEATNSATKTTPFKQGYPIIGIDAIVLPAEATSAQLQKLSFLKDDSGVQLVSTVATNRNAVEGLDEQPQESAAKLTDLLKFDSLLPLNAPLVAPTAATITTLATTATLKATTVTGPEISTTTTSSTTTTKRTTASNQMAFSTSKITRRGGGVDLQSTTTTTNMPKQTSTLLAVDGKRVTQQDQDENEERTRSVTLPVSAPTIASSSSTVNEPETTANLLTSSPNLLATTLTSINASHKQLDETTLIEMPAEAADVERQGSGVLAQTMLKKMKVEPVVVEHKTAITDRDDDEDDDLFVNPTTPLPSLRSNLASAQVVNHNNDHYDKADTHDDHDHAVDHHDPNLDRAVDDRFSYQPVGGDGVETTVEDEGDGDVDASGLHKVGAAASTQLVQDKSTTTTALHVQAMTTKKSPITKPTISSTTTTANSEIDVAAELRAINELVKQNQRRRPQGAIKKKTTMAAKTTTKSDLKATTKAASGFKISGQQMGKITTESATSASSETATTATTAAIEADVSATASTTAARVTTETIPAETLASAASTMTTAGDSSATATATVAAVEATTATLETETPTASEIATATIATTTMPSTTTMATITPTSAPTATSSSLATIIDDAATSTASLWAKILPLLGFPTTTTQITDLPATATSPTATQTQSSSSSSSKSTLSSTNRSLRNSKITRIDKLSTNSLSDSNAKKATTTTTEAMTTTTTAKQTSSGSRVKAYVVPFSQSVSELSTVLPPTTTARTKSRDDGGFSPFWWVPAGWRLDRPSTSGTLSEKSSSSSSSSSPTSSSSSPSSSTATTRTTSTSTLNKRAEVAATAQPSSLLLRFWSAFPGNQVKVKE